MNRPMASEQRGDEGAAMVMVLIVVLFMALVSTAFLAKSGTALKAGSVLHTKVDLQYGADAGLEKGIKTVQADLVASSTRLCLTPFGGKTEVASFDWTANGFDVTASCQTLQGFAAGGGSSLYGAAIVTTGDADALVTEGAMSNNLGVEGSIYASTTPAGGPDIDLEKGDLAVRGCTTNPDPAGRINIVPAGAPYGEYCTALTPVQVAARYTLPATVPGTAPAPYTTASGNCRIFLPGRYTSVPALLNGNNDTNYFASGVYYFENVGEWNLANKMRVVAGAPQAGYSGAGTGLLTPCGGGDTKAKEERPAADVNGEGATFILGGSSRILVNESLVIHQRTVTAANPLPTSVYVVRSTDPSPWVPWSGGTSYAITDGNATPTMEFNGAINAFDASVKVFASNPTTAAIRAGVIAKTFTLKASASAADLSVTGYGSGSSAGSRIVRITSSAKGVSGNGGQSDGVAIVEFYNDGTTPPRVISWRFE